MNNVQPFNFENHGIRAVDAGNGEIAFVAKDVAEALGYAWNGTSRISHVPEEWRGVTSVVTPSGTHRMAVLSEQGLYFFLGRSDKPKALPFQKWIAGDVLPSIRKNGFFSALDDKKPNIAATTAMVELTANLLNVSDSGKVVMLRKAGESLGADMGFLPAYTVDAAPGSDGSSMETYSLSHLLREYGLRVPASQVNVMLGKAGILQQKYRKGSRGQLKTFWNVTSKGLAYGKNITSPQSPRETQPHWYRETFSELLAQIGMERAA